MKAIVVAALLVQGLTGSLQVKEAVGGPRPAREPISRGIVTVEAIPTVIVEAKSVKGEKRAILAAIKKADRKSPSSERAVSERDNGEYALH